MRALATQPKAATADGTATTPLLSRHRPAEPPLQIQRKLSVGATNDPLEHEADRIAEQVMRMPENQTAHSSSAPATVMLNRSASSGGGGFAAPPVVHDVLNSPGRPLETATRTFMEPRFGQDFSSVRVHADAKAAEATRAIHADAFTAGRDIVFDAGRYAPDSASGRRLLSHELAHVAQQKQTGESYTSALNANEYLVQRQYGSGDSSKEADPNALIPIEDFISYVETVEQSFPKDTPEEIVTRIRVHSYGGLKFNQAVPDAEYTETRGGYMPVDFQRDLSGMRYSDKKETAYKHLTSHADENPSKEKPHGDNPSPYIVMPDSSRIDVGHLLYGFDALLHPRAGEPFRTYGVQGIDAASWVADLALPVFWTTYQIKNKNHEPYDDAPVKPKEADFDAYYKASAPTEDLVGDADAFGLNTQSTAPVGKKLSVILRAYYLGARGKQPGVNNRWRNFCAANELDYEESAGQITWSKENEDIWVPRIDRLCDLFQSGMAGSAWATVAGAPKQQSWQLSVAALRRFLAWVKPRLEKEIASDR